MDTKYTLDNLSFSQHSKERYAERIMNKESKLDITVFIIEHEQKIKEDIYKMIQYGTLIFSGKPNYEYNKQAVDIFLNGSWVIIIDILKCKVITLYSIDLGLGNEFNQEYINKLMHKLHDARAEFDSINDNINAQKETYTEIIKDNTAQINELRSIINCLEKQNQAYADVIGSLEADKLVAEKNIRDIVATFIGKKVF